MLAFRRVRTIVPGAATGSVLLIVLLVPIYLVTAVAGDDVNVDAEAAAVQSWHLAATGSIDLNEADLSGRPELATVLGRNPWIVATADGGVVSNRPPGLWLLGVPAYLLVGADDYSAAPATATAAALTVAAVVIMHLVLRRSVPPWWALGGALLLGLGTATWPISSSQLWPHGAVQLLFATSLLCAATGRAVWSGVALAVQVTVRPVTAVVPLVLSAARALERRWSMSAALLVPPSVALVATATYNGVVFGSFDLPGGYQPAFADNLLNESLLRHLERFLLFFVSPTNGLLFWSPMVIVALVGVGRVWRDLPPWARHATIGALALVVVQTRMNRVSGGLPFDYRYPLGPLTLAFPALVVATKSVVERYRRGAAMLAATALLSIALQGLVAVTASCEPTAAGVATCTLGGG